MLYIYNDNILLTKTNKIMEALFQPKETVVYDGKEVEVICAKMNFQTKKISYRLKEVETLVPQEDLKPVKAKTVAKATGTEEEKLEAARTEYKRLYKKDVAPAYKNKLEWILEKNEKMQASLDANPVNPGGNANETGADGEGDTELTFDAISEMDADGIEALIAEKELDIDPETYEEPEELINDICEELGIEVPKE